MEERRATEKFLTIRDVATLFGISPATVYRLTMRRKIPFLKVGGQIRFKRLSLDAWARQHEKPTLAA